MNLPKRTVWESLRLILLVLLSIGAAIPAAAQDSAACADGFHAFTHALGTNCIPEQPQRVIALDTGELDNALALGAPVVGAPLGDVQQYQTYLSDQLDGIADTGSISEPNLEAILALNPDLILGSKQRYEAIYEQLAQIAPTVLTESLRVPWQDNFRLHAAALGKTAEADQLLADYAAHITEIQTALGDALDTTTISIIRFRPGQVRLYLKSSYIGYILQDVGLPRPPSQDEDVFSAEISLEQVQAVDADYIFVTGYAEDDSELATFLNSPLWQTLGAVQAGHVVDVNDDTWIAGLGVQSANQVLDDLKTLLATTPAQASAACDPGFRLFDQEYLGSDPVCIPEDPQRIAVLDLSTLEVALIQGVRPVAMYGYGRDLIVRSNPNIHVDVMGLTAETVDVGNASATNLEALLAADPDLIIALPYAAETSGLATFQEIAPTLIFDAPLDIGEYRSSVAFMAAVLNTPEAGADQLAQLDARLEAFKEMLGEDLETTNISLTRLRDSIILFIGGSFGDHLIHEAGLIRPEPQQPYNIEFVETENNGWVGIEVSEENLPLVDGEYIFVWTASPSAEVEAEARELIATLQEDPLWNTLAGVQNDHLFIVGSHWQGFGILEAHAALDDLFRYVAGVDPQAVAPNPFLVD